MTDKFLRKTNLSEEQHKTNKDMIRKIKLLKVKIKELTSELDNIISIIDTLTGK